MSGRARRTRKRRADLSQHFLRQSRAAALIGATSITCADLVVEIGAGRGALTTPLRRRAGRLVAVEIDPYLAAALQRALGQGVDVVAADFLEWPMPTEPFKVVGNVPYAIASPIVRKLVTAVPPPLDAWLVVQREVAHRLCGHPFGHESLWSLRLKPDWHVEIVDHLKRTDFDPPPSVDSVWLWMSRRERPILTGGESALYVDLIEAGYRGGTVAQAVRPWLSKIQLRRLAADFRFRTDSSPAAMSFEQWLGILRFVQRSAGRDRP